MRYNPGQTAEAESTATAEQGTIQVQDDGQLVANEAELRKSPAVVAIANRLNINDQQQVVEFGSDSANKVTDFADRVLHSVKASTVSDSTVMLKQLATIMTKFDIKDFEREGQGLFGKLIHRGQSILDQMLAKYRTVGDEMDKVFKTVNNYKLELTKSTETLEQLFTENLDYFHELGNYVIAGKMVLEELNNEDLPALKKAAESGNQEDINNLETLQNIVDMLQQRVNGLEIARTVAIQNAPKIRTMQKGNANLIMKIQEAFIITIPLFKSELLQAVELKRQKVAADGMAALDDATNKLLLKTADNTARQSAQIAQLASAPSIKPETLQQRQQTILNGVEEVRRIEADNRAKAETTAREVAKMQEELKTKMRGWATH